MRLTLLAWLIAYSVGATEVSAVFFPSTVSGAGLDTALINIKKIGGDTILVDKAYLPQWRKKSDHTKIGGICTIRTDGKGIKEWKDVPLAQIETRITKGVAPPYKQQIIILSMEDFEAQYEPISE